MRLLAHATTAMTVITFRPGYRARTRRASAAAAISLILGMLLVFAPSAARAGSSPSPTPTLSGVLALNVSPTGDGVLRAGEALTTWLTVSNGTAQPYPGGTGVVSIGTAGLADRGALTSWLAGDADTPPGVDAGTAAVPSAQPGEAARAVVTVDAQDPNLANRAPGVYPLWARAEGPSGTVTARSVVVVPRSEGAAPVGLVVPVTAQPLSGALLTSDELAEQTAPDGALTGVLDAVSGTPAILAVDPAIPAAIRVLGRSAPATATAWLDRLLALSNERFALQFGDADAGVQIRSGAPAPLQPSSLQSFLSAANFTATGDSGQATSTPTPTASPGGAVYPTLDELLDVGATREGVYWPASGTAGAGVVAALSAATPGALTLVDSASTGADAGSASARGQAGDAAVLVYDAAVSGALRDAAGQPDSTLRGTTVAAASAYLSFATASGAPVLAVLDRGSGSTRQGLRAAVLAVTQSPGATPTSLDALAAAAPVEVTVDDVAADDERVAAASDLSADESRLRDFSSVLADPDPLLGPERAEILQLLGAGWLADPEGWRAAIAAHRAATATTLDAVGILPTDFNLAASGADLGYWVRNDLPWPVTVTLYATPDDLRLDVGTGIAVTAEPESNTRVPVPVQARIGTGDVTVALQLRSATGVQIGSPQYAQVNVRAEWELGGGIVLGVLIVAFLVVGVIRTVRRRRAAADAATPGDAP